MDTATTPALVGTARCAELAHVTYRQLDYWCRQGVLAPAMPARGSGSRIMFTRAEVLQAALCGVLSELHCPTEVMRRVVEAVEPLRVANWYGSIVAYPTGEVHLVNKVATAAWVADLAAVKRRTLEGNED